MGGKSTLSRRLAVAAQHDVDEIWLFSAQQWSNEQADRYVDELYDTFDLLVGFPLLARERNELSPPARLHPYRSHLILYRVVDDQLVILRVLHMHQDWRSVLESGEV